MNFQGGGLVGSAKFAEISCPRRFVQRRPSVTGPGSLSAPLEARDEYWRPRIAACTGGTMMEVCPRKKRNPSSKAGACLIRVPSESGQPRLLLLAARVEAKDPQAGGKQQQGCGERDR